MFTKINIDKYIKESASDRSISKGLQLYFDRAVVSFELIDNNQVFAKVQGTTLYKVGITIQQNNKIIASCTCPYNYGGLCKHQIAVLYQLKNYLKNNIVTETIGLEQLSISKKNHNTEEFIEIKNYENLSIAAIQNISKGVYYNYNSFDISLDGISSDFVIFKVRNWEGDNNVEFQFIKDKLYFNCTCNSDVKTLCKHQLAVLYEVKREFGKYFFNTVKASNVDKIINEAAKSLGLPPNIDHKKFFKIDYSNNKLVALPTGEAAGLISISENLVKENEFISVVNQDFNPLSISNYNENYGLGFVFFIRETDSRFNPYAYIEFLLISGKLGKNDAKLINPIRELDDYDSNKIQLSSTDEELFKLSKLSSVSFIDDYVESHDLAVPEYQKALNKLISKHYESIMPKIKELLISKPFIYKTFSKSLTTSELQPIKISYKTVELFFNLTESDLFYSLDLVVKLGNIALAVDDENLIYHRPFILEYFSEFYFISNSQDDYIIAENIEQELGVKIAKNNFLGLFENYIQPISKKYKINFDIKSILIKKEQPKQMKKQLYISELGNFILFKPYVLYNETMQVNILEHGTILEYADGTVIESYRNFEFEKQYYDLIKSIHPKFKNQFNDNFFHINFNDFVENQWFLNAFDNLKTDNVEVFGLSDLKKFKYSTHKAVVNVNISSGQDWFDVKIEVAFGDEHISLKDLKKAVLKNEKFVKLSDGTLGILPEEWFAKFERYLRQGQVKKDELKISKLKFSIIDELFDEKDYAEIMQEIKEKQQRLKDFSEIKKLKVPAKLKGELRDYQKAGYNWLNFLDEFKWGGILADDMGLGKTIQVLAFLLKKTPSAKKASLIVLPTTLLFNWDQEIEKFAPSLKVFFHYGTNRAKDVKEFKNYDIIITTYGTMTRDIAILQKYKFNYVILDESQAIKNPNSQRFKAATLFKADNRLALTGTPIENNTFDLFAQMEFLNPGFLGTQKQFKNDYSNAIDKDQNPVIAAELQNLINPFILRRTKEQVATELPPKIEDVIFCEMEKEQRNVYDAFRNKYRNMLLNKIEDDGLGKSKIYVLEGLMKLRQICDSPEILAEEENYGKDSVKIKELVRHIKQKTGNHKILVFSQFVKMLSVIKRELQKEDIIYEYLDGKSSRKGRQASVEHFQSDEKCRVFLISLKAGGTGLNLTAADYVYIVDPWWNPAVENQAIDRCYRIGQDKKVIAYRMICKNTIEEKIMKYQAKKQKIASDIISTDESFIKQLDKSDIEDLFT